MSNPLNAPIEAVSLMTLAVAVFGPQTGPYVVIVLGAIGGGMWALSNTTLETRRQGLWLMLKCVLTAVVLTAVIAGIVGPWFKIPVTEAYAIVSFSIGAIGDGWKDVFESVKSRLQALISNAGGKQS